MSFTAIRPLLVALIAGGWIGAALWARRGPTTTAAAPPPPTLTSAAPAPLALGALREGSAPAWLRDGDLRLVGVNAAYAALVGADGPETTIAEQAELSPAARTLAAQARDSGRAAIAPERVTAQGRRQVMEFVHLPLPTGEVLGLAVDGSARHAAANHAARQMRALTEALSQFGGGIALFDPGGLLAWRNPAFDRLFRLEPDWLDTCPHFEDMLDAMLAGERLPETRDFAGWKAERRRWLRLDAEPAIETWRLPAGYIFAVRAQPRSDGGLVLLVEDETERVRLAGERVALLKVHQVTLDHLSEGVAVFGPDGAIKLLNRRAAEVLLVPREVLENDPSAEMLMEHVKNFLSEPERAQRLRDLILSATSERQSRTGQVVSTLGYQVDYRTVPLPDGNALLVFASEKVAEPA